MAYSDLRMRRHIASACWEIMPSPVPVVDHLAYTLKLPTSKVGKQGSSHQVHASCLARVGVPAPSIEGFSRGGSDPYGGSALCLRHVLLLFAGERFFCSQLDYSMEACDSMFLQGIH